MKLESLKGTNFPEDILEMLIKRRDQDVPVEIPFDTLMEEIKGELTTAEASFTQFLSDDLVKENESMNADFKKHQAYQALHSEEALKNTTIEEFKKIFPESIEMMEKELEDLNYNYK